MVNTVISASICAHSGCMLGMTPSVGEAVEVGVVDQLHVGDHGPAVPRPVGLDRVFDGVERLADRGVADGVDVDLKAELVDLLGGLGQAVALPDLHAVDLCSPEQYGASSAPVSFSTTPSAKNLTVCAVSSGEPVSRHRRRDSREVLHLRIEIARVGVERQVESHPEGVAAGRLDVGVDVAGIHPGVLHPGHAPGQVVVGRRTERRDRGRPRHAAGIDGGDEVDRAPLPQGSEHGAVVAVRDLAEHGIGCLRRDPGPFAAPRS